MSTEITVAAAAKRPDNRVIKLQNEEKVLDALHRYGFLYARQIGALCWPVTASARQAQRTLDNLKRAGEVQRQCTPAGIPVYCLTAAGARRLQALSGVAATSGANNLKRSFHHVDHRAVANDICIWWETCGWRLAGGVNTEHQIATHQGVVRKVEALFGEKKGKIPDGLLFQKPLADGKTIPVTWVEAESRRKRGDEMRHMVSVLAHMLGGYGNNKFELDQKGHEVHDAVIACPDEKHELAVGRAVLDLLAEGAYSIPKMFSAIMLWPVGSDGFIDFGSWVLKHPDLCEAYKVHRNLAPHLEPKKEPPPPAQ